MVSSVGSIELFPKDNISISEYGNGINEKGYVIINDPARSNWNLARHFYTLNRDKDIEVITVGTTNEAKLDTVHEVAVQIMQEFGINRQLCIAGIKVFSDVPDQPLNEQTLIGSRNRVANLHFWAQEAGIRKGLLVGIEGGYEKDNLNQYSAFTAITIAEKNSWYQRSTKCSFFPITKRMFDYVMSGNDLNDLIGRRTGIENHNQKGGVTGFLSDDLCNRKNSDKAGLYQLLVSYFKEEKMMMLERWIEEELSGKKTSYTEVVVGKKKENSPEIAVLNQGVINGVISWEQYFMGIALLSARRSKDPSTQVGACIVGTDNRILSTGYNGTPNGVKDCEFIWTREGEFLDTKYPYVIHAEPNAILNFKGDHHYLDDSTIFVTLFPCNECAKFIAQSGVKHIVYLSDKYANMDSFIAAKRLFDMCGISYVSYHDLVKEKNSVLQLNYVG